MNKPRLALGGLVLVLIGAAFGGGWYLGDRQGRATGFSAGVRYGEVQASKKAPIPVRNQNHSTASLLETGALKKLPLAADEAEGLSSLLNQAISPCKEGVRRGVSLASSLLDPELGCAAVTAQVQLALAVMRTYGGGAGASDEVRAAAVEEGVAVLRVERRVPIPRETYKTPRGNPGAVVTLTVFSDYQCPYCVQGEKLVQDFLTEYGDQVRVVPRHLPLTRIHPAAWPAAVATEAAAVQGKFWEMHDALFALGPKGLAKIVDRDDPIPAEGSVPFEAQADEIGLDVGQFREDLRSLEIQERVQDDMDLARELGVGGTPAFFFDGREVSGRRSPKLFGKLLAKAEAEADWRFSWGLEPPPRGADVPEGVMGSGAEGEAGDIGGVGAAPASPTP